MSATFQASCLRCGYDIASLVSTTPPPKCPECGVIFEHWTAGPARPRGQGFRAVWPVIGPMALAAPIALAFFLVTRLALGVFTDFLFLPLGLAYWAIAGVIFPCAVAYGRWNETRDSPAAAWPVLLFLLVALAINVAIAVATAGLGLGIAILTTPADLFGP